MLEGTGALTWELLATPVEEEDLITSLAEGFQTDPTLVRRDVLPFLEQLRVGGAVRSR